MARCHSRRKSRPAVRAAPRRRHDPSPHPNRTNITEQYASFTNSRGHLVSSFLTSPSSPSLEDDARRVVPPDARYAGFNLALFAPASPSSSISFDALYVTNHGAGGPITSRAFTDAQRHRGGLSNGIDGDGADAWPKVQHGVRALDALLNDLPPGTSEDELTERLFDLLTWVYRHATRIRSTCFSFLFFSFLVFFRLRWRSSQPPHDRSELRHTIQVDPVNLADNVEGTRLSTVVLVKHSGEVAFTERDRWTLDAQGRPILADPSSQRVFRFKVERNDALSE